MTAPPTHESTRPLGAQDQFYERRLAMVALWNQATVFLVVVLVWLDAAKHVRDTWKLMLDIDPPTLLQYHTHTHHTDRQTTVTLLCMLAEG